MAHNLMIGSVLGRDYIADDELHYPYLAEKGVQLNNFYVDAVPQIIGYTLEDQSDPTRWRPVRFALREEMDMTTMVPTIIRTPFIPASNGTKVVATVHVANSTILDEVEWAVHGDERVSILPDGTLSMPVPGYDERLHLEHTEVMAISKYNRTYHSMWLRDITLGEWEFADVPEGTWRQFSFGTIPRIPTRVWFPYNSSRNMLEIENREGFEDGFYYRLNQRDERGMDRLVGPMHEMNEIGGRVRLRVPHNRPPFISGFPSGEGFSHTNTVIPEDQQLELDALTPGIPRGEIVRSTLIQTYEEGSARPSVWTSEASGYWLTTNFNTGAGRVIITNGVLTSNLEYVSPKIFPDDTFFRDWAQWDGIATTNPNTGTLTVASEHVGWERERFFRTTANVSVNWGTNAQGNFVIFSANVFMNDGSGISFVVPGADVSVSGRRDPETHVITGSITLRNMQWRWPLHLRQYDVDGVAFYWASVDIWRRWIINQQTGFLWTNVSPPRPYGSDRRQWWLGGGWRYMIVHESPEGDLFDENGNPLEEEYDEETGNRYLIIERIVVIVCPDTGEEKEIVVRDRIPIPPRRPRWIVGSNPRIVYNDPQERFIITNTQHHYMLHSPDGNAWESGNMVYDPRNQVPAIRTVLANNGENIALFDRREFASNDARRWTLERTLPIPQWWAMTTGSGTFEQAVTLSTPESLAFVMANLDLVGHIDFPVDGSEIRGPIMIYGDGVYILATEGAETVHITRDYAVTWEPDQTPVRLGRGLLGCYGMDFWVIGQRIPVEGNNVSNIYDGTMWGSIPMPTGCVAMAAGAEVFAAVRPEPHGGFLPDETAVIFLPVEDAWDDDDDD